MRWFIKNGDIGFALLIGISGYLLWMRWLFFPVSVFLQLSAIVCLFLHAIFRVKHIVQASTPEKLVWGCVFLLTLLYGIPVFTPEVGFDALWYHLPITQVFLNTHAVSYIPELYQSAMPRLGSYIFVPAYYFANTMGVKIVVFISTIALFLVWYRMAKVFLHRSHAVYASLLFYAFHVVSWQASSAYVDQLRALFEFSAFVVLISARNIRFGRVLIAGVLLGFSLSTKLLSLFFFPGFLLYFFVRKNWKVAGIILCVALFTVIPWYVQSYAWTGNPFFPLFQQLDGSIQINEQGFAGWRSWSLHQLALFPALSFLTAFHKESYTTPFFILIFPFLFSRWHWIREKFTLYGPMLVYMFVVWLLIPPLSIRYALFGFGVFLIFSYALFLRVAQHNIWVKRWGVVVLVCGLSVHLVFRSIVAGRSILFLTHRSSLDTYLKRNAQGLATGPFEKWYGGYWKNYRFGP
ncbi:MAG: hypothetical protein HZA34_05005 [Candidatus Pacebacteria bacterium]|nr:hypothetical protein [Candidatus Paceibacterota bacterium]